MHEPSLNGNLLKLSAHRLTYLALDYAATAGGPYGGIVAYSADADTVVWSTSSNGVLRSQNQGTFAAVASLPLGAVLASDKRKDTFFYGGSGGSFYVSSDTGSTFSKGGTLASATSIRDITAHPVVAGEVWVSTDVGLFRSTDFGATFTQAGSALTNTQQVALGLSSGTSWNVYVFGSGSAGNKLYASSDSGATWTDVQGSQGFGSIASCKLAGSANKANQVYVGTNGRGVFYASGAVSGGGSSATASATTSSSMIKPSTTTVSSTKAAPSSSTSKTTTSVLTTIKPGSTTLATTVRTSSTGSSSAPTTAVVQHWAQCGGVGWMGPTGCVPGTTCKKQNDYYWQCL